MKEGAQIHTEIIIHSALDPSKIVGSVHQKWLVAAED